ncbi:very short patch repair endonuclease [Cellulomonas sp. HZM]|uniref:very short patch repair endonuclease n=1 Tax=Cellulomonas sp. HZM TaxID=1454010 RepID=UPI001E32B32A|nr:DNA mismatch endonuclease Vsr [Cellulomonas sp. HZM]
MDVNPKTSARMARVRSRDTTPEMALRRELHRRGRRFYVNRRLLGDRRTADIVFPRARLAVFVDGCFWHMCPRHGTQSHTNSDWWREKLSGNVERDRRTDVDLAAAGWAVLRVWEHDSVAGAAEAVEEALRRLRPDL